MLFVVFLSGLYVSLFVCFFFRLGHPCYSHPLSQAGHFVSPGNRSVLSLSLAVTMNKNQTFYAQWRLFSLFFFLGTAPSKYEELETLYANVGKVIFEGLTNYERCCFLLLLSCHKFLVSCDICIGSDHMCKKLISPSCNKNVTTLVEIVSRIDSFEIVFVCSQFV